jgi:EREBP-like factor
VVVAATSSHSSTIESWSGGGAVLLRAPAIGAPAVEEDCRSYCGSSSSALCEDGASAEAAAPLPSTSLPFDLNLEAAADDDDDEMDWRCDTLLRL